MNIKEIKYTVDEIDKVVEILYAMMANYKVITFTGSLGAGKTTLVKSLLRRCGINGVITSPTFTYLNVYENDQHQMFYHFDCYRIKTVEDFKAAGFDEYLYQPHSWTFIEWPEVVSSLINHEVIRVNIEYDGEQRVLTIQVSDIEK